MREKLIQSFLSEIFLLAKGKQKLSIIIGAYIGDDFDTFNLIQKNAENKFSAFKIVSRSKNEISFESSNAIIILTSEKSEDELDRYMFDELIILRDD